MKTLIALFLSALVLSAATPPILRTDFTTNALSRTGLVLTNLQQRGGTIGTAVTYTLNPGNSFTLSTDSVLDTSTFSYIIVEVP